MADHPAVALFLAIWIGSCVVVLASLWLLVRIGSRPPKGGDRG